MPLTKLNATLGLTGTLPAVSGANLTGISAGKVLQVVSTQLVAEFGSSSSSFVDVTGMALTITPSATSSKILLLMNTNLYQNTGTSYVILRYERAISGGATTNIGHGTYGLTFARSEGAHNFWAGTGMTYLDSPSTTSATTYQVQVSNGGSGSVSVGVNSSNTNSIYALEIE
jgi:hypothetical protein